MALLYHNPNGITTNVQEVCGAIRMKYSFYRPGFSKRFSHESPGEAEKHCFKGTGLRVKRETFSPSVIEKENE